MWLCFNDGFVSAVEDRTDFDTLVIRSRRKEILNDLFGEENVLENVGTDYKYRVYVKREEFADLVRERIMNIDYDNFKNSVRDYDLHNLYGNWWVDHYRYQR